MLTLSTVVAVGVGGAWADDVIAPDPPNEVFVSHGSEWRSQNYFDVWWHTPPGQQSPIVAAHYQLCPAVPLGPCSTHKVTEAGISQIDVTLPHVGWFVLRLWLEDESGNVNPEARSTGVILRFDDEVPPEAFLRNSGSWLGNTTPISPTYVVDIGAATGSPLSGIKGYSITLDGTVPDDEVAFAAQDYERFAAPYVSPGVGGGNHHPPSSNGV